VVKLGAWDRLSLGAVRCFLVALMRVISLPGLYQVGCVFGTLEWLINFKRRRRFYVVLSAVLGRRPTRRERIRHARAHFTQSRCDKIFYMIFDRLSSDRAAALFSITRREVFDEAVDRGKGVCLAVSHYGPQHVFALFLALFGYKIVGVRDRKESALRRYIQDRIDRFCPACGRAPFLYADSFPREIYRLFRKGFVVGSAMDVHRVRQLHQKTETVEVFGQRREFLSGPMHIAVRSGAAVVQAFLIAEKNFRYRMDVVGLLIDPDAVADESETVAAAMQTYATNVEAQLRRNPATVSRI
jgi:lauroyl/myristoyl acyltransferase